jgi:hypothetical protein
MQTNNVYFVPFGRVILWSVQLKEMAFPALHQELQYHKIYYFL